MNCRSRLLAPVALVAVLGTACGAGEASQTAATTTTLSKTAGPGPESLAASLRSTLASRLQEHVFLAGIATGTALAGDDLAPAAAALDENSQDLADAIGSLYGAEAGDAFLPIWRSHIDMIVEYTTGAATGDEVLTAKAEADLTQYAEDFGAFLQSVNPNLTKAAVASLLGPHAKTLLAAIDAQAADSPEQFEKLRSAAEHMPVMAATLAGAIQKQQAEKITGTVDSFGSTLRVELTDTLQEHVYLAGIATKAALSGGMFDESAKALDANSVDLSNLIAVTYGDAAGAKFLDLWRQHIGFFVDYTTAAGAGDAAGMRKAKTDLSGYAVSFAAFLGQANPKLDVDEVARGLGGHATSLLKVIDAQASDDPAQFESLRLAAGHMPDFAQLLATALVAQFPERFGA